MKSRFALDITTRKNGKN